MLLQHGDCLALMRALPSESVDMILCDLPYGTTECRWDTVIPFDRLWAQYERIIKPHGAIVLFGAQPFTTRLIASNYRLFRYCWYWRKRNATGGIFAKQQPMRCIEDICVFYKHLPPYHPQGLRKLDKPVVNRPVKSEVIREKKKPSVQEYTGYPNHLLEFAGVNVGSVERVHPTQKPVALLEYLIRTYTDAGDTVLDSCMGSGSTGVACAQSGRDFIGMELDDRYFAIVEQRIAAAEGALPAAA